MERKIVKCTNCPAEALVDADAQDESWRQWCSEISERLIVEGSQSGQLPCRYMDPLIHAAIKELRRKAKDE